MNSVVGVLLWMTVATSVPHDALNEMERLDTRLEFLEEAFDDQQLVSMLWWWGWVSGYSVSALGSFGVAYQDLYPNRTTSLWTNGIKSSLAVLNMILFRPCVQCDGGTRFRALAEDSLEAKRDKLLVGEQMLQRMAAEGSRHFKWARHLLGIGVNTTVSALLWQELKQDPAVPREEVAEQVLTSAIVGLVVTELNIFSEPWGAPRRLREYAGFEEGSESSFQWWFQPIPNGISWVGRF